MGRTTILLLACLAMAGCNEHVGDSCGNTTDCSPTGALQCDLAQPGGYCTAFACDPDTCSEGACVEWRFLPSRTAETWCMKTCDNNGWCRAEYSCVLPTNITVTGDFDPDLPADERVARIIDLDSYKAVAKICVALTPGGARPEASVDPGFDGGL